MVRITIKKFFHLPFVFVQINPFKYWIFYIIIMLLPSSVISLFIECLSVKISTLPGLYIYRLFVSVWFISTLSPARHIIFLLLLCVHNSIKLSLVCNGRRQQSYVEHTFVQHFQNNSCTTHYVQHSKASKLCFTHIQKFQHMKKIDCFQRQQNENCFFI